MDVLIEFGKILLPAIIVLYAVYLTIKTLLQKDIEKKLLDYKMESNKIVLPLRLQAFERMSLFLERITPNQLIVRLNQSSLSAREFQHMLIAEVREEYNHNLSQQVYISDNAWAHIRNTVEDVIAIVNSTASKLSADASSIDLAKAIFKELERRGSDPVQETLSVLKAEIKDLF
jgi:hypothetical protein